MENKRLAIDLKALRQYVWERDGTRTGEIDSSSGDYPRWIDTSTMVVDPLTKVMKADRLETFLESGMLDLRPTDESLATKERKRLIRQNAKKPSKPS